MSTHHLIKRMLAAGAVIATAGFPAAAQAMYFDGHGGSVPMTTPVIVSHASQTALGPTDASSGGYVRVSAPPASQAVLGPTDASSGGYDLATSSTPATAQSGSGFNWNDAGIGAGGAVLLLGTAALGVGATRRRRSAVLS